MGSIDKLSFISAIAPIIISEARERGYKCVSCAIAQACIESRFGASSLAANHHNYFGMKKGSANVPFVTLNTKEYVNGAYVTVSAKFRHYDSMRDGVKGYYDFLNYKNYAGVKKATTPALYADALIAGRWATSPTYKENLLRYIQIYNLAVFDNELKSNDTSSDIGKIVQDTLKGKYGNGADRKRNLGNLYGIVQDKINQILRRK